MTCKWFDKLLDDHLAGRLGRFRTFLFHVHMKICPPCGKYLDQYRRAVEAAQSQKAQTPTPAPLEPELAEQIVRQMNNDATTKPS